MRKTILIHFIAFFFFASHISHAQTVAANDNTSVNNKENNPALQNENDVVLYPNPAESEVNVIYDPNAGIKNIVIYDLIGKAMSVYHVSGGSANLNIDTLPSGIYFMRLIGAQGNVIATRKFTHR